MTKTSLTLVAFGLGVVSVFGCRERNPAYVGPKDGAAADAPSERTGPDARGDAADGALLPPESRDGSTGDAAVDQRDAGPDNNVEDDGGPGPRDGRDARDTPRPGDERPGAEAGEDLPAREVPDAPAVPDAVDTPVLPLDVGVDGVPADTAPVDAPPACHEQETRSCSSPQNPLIGACRAGVQTCTGGSWGNCVGEVKPLGAEICGNGTDDDCNGITDDGCTDGCIVVGPSANSATPEGTPSSPFPTVEAALAFVTSADGGTAARICVAASACDQSQAYPSSGSLAVPGGVSVQGNYALQAGVLSYCADAQPPVTALQLGAADATVLFAAGAIPTELGSFVIERYGQASSGTVAAITVHGAKNVTLSGIFVTDAPTGDSTYGVLVDGGGSVTVTHSAIRAGAGSTSAHGIFANGGSVTLRDNCDGAAGRCASSCADGVLGIRGRGAANVADATGESSAVYVAAGSSGSSIVGNLLCGGPGGGASDVLAAAVATLRCAGGACATVAGNAIEGGAGRFSLGIAMASGGGLLDGNRIAAGCGSLGAAGMLLEAAAVRAQNNLIVATPCSSTSGAGAFQGVRMVLSAGAEADLNGNDIDPGGSGGDCEARGIDVVRSQAGTGTGGILRNNIIAAGNCRTRTALYEGENAGVRLIENNDLYAQPTASGATVTTTLVRRAGSNATTAVQVNLLAGATGNLSANPQFAAYPDDLHLTLGSPCIDRGTSAGAPSSDFDGKARPQGERFDIGAYEY